MVQDSMKSFQDNVQAEIQGLKSKVCDIESQVLDMKFNVNQKINGEEVRDIIDKKMLIL